MKHIDLYAKLYLQKMYHPAPESDECITHLQNFFRSLTGEEILPDHMRQVFQPKYAPQMNQLIPALLRQGIQAKHLAEHFKVTRATISYHSTHQSKKEYTHYGFSRILDNVIISRDSGRRIHVNVYNP